MTHTQEVKNCLINHEERTFPEYAVNRLNHSWMILIGKATLFLFCYYCRPCGESPWLKLLSGPPAVTRYQPSCLASCPQWPSDGLFSMLMTLVLIPSSLLSHALTINPTKESFSSLMNNEQRTQLQLECETESFITMTRWQHVSHENWFHKTS